jgi:hypothetical protein
MEPVQFHNPPPSAQAPQAQEQGNGLAVAGMVLGIIGLVFCWVPVLGWILALLGLIFGAVGNGKANKIGGKGKGMALAGLIMGVLGLIIGIALFIWAVKKTNEMERRYRYNRYSMVQPAPTAPVTTPDLV